ncbi:hypothetical protein GCK32_012508 [Trichostrongylus colubriformis]|uniref:Uncharacterized protein n=1 Tax=Trichostrongylus colubriformis TaxID=6319 RepID=A0AAN8F887_TRICO
MAISSASPAPATGHILQLFVDLIPLFACSHYFTSRSRQIGAARARLRQIVGDNKQDQDPSRITNAPTL